MSKASDFVKKAAEAKGARPSPTSIRSSDSTSSVILADVDDKGFMTLKMPGIVSAGQVIAFKPDAALTLGQWLIDTFSDGKKRKQRKPRSKRETLSVADANQVPANGNGSSEPPVLRQPEDLSQSL